MKKQILLALMCMVAFLGAAKDLKTLRITTEPQMSCSNCENKIKKNIRFEKGVHQISTDLKGQVVTVVYDADKTDEDKIIKAFDKIKYKAIILDDCSKAVATDSCHNCCKANGDKEQNK
ncbi:MAG: heavy-metal-associated domain-containing protein [Muribaculaceae bacterium]|nr:heavy-metal-associated domain-containing protein [Muribaculaceae bacterium]